MSGASLIWTADPTAENEMRNISSSAHMRGVGCGLFRLTVQAQSSIDATKSAAEKGDAEAQKALESINKNKDVPAPAAK